MSSIIQGRAIINAALKDISDCPAIAGQETCDNAHRTATQNAAGGSLGGSFNNQSARLAGVFGECL
jgi:hypothetical protein